MIPATAIHPAGNSMTATTTPCTRVSIGIHIVFQAEALMVAEVHKETCLFKIQIVMGFIPDAPPRETLSQYLVALIRVPSMFRFAMAQSNRLIMTSTRWCGMITAAAKTTERAG